MRREARLTPWLALSPHSMKILGSCPVQYPITSMYEDSAPAYLRAMPTSSATTGNSP